MFEGQETERGESVWKDSVEKKSTAAFGKRRGISGAGPGMLVAVGSFWSFSKQRDGTVSRKLE